MQWHDHNWMPYRILRGDIVRGLDIAETEEEVIVYTKIPLTLFNIIMGILAGHTSHASYKIDNDIVIHEVEYPRI